MKKLLLLLLTIDQIVVIVSVLKAIATREMIWYAASAGSVTLLSVLASGYFWLEIKKNKPQ